MHTQPGEGRQKQGWQFFRRSAALALQRRPPRLTPWLLHLRRHRDEGGSDMIVETLEGDLLDLDRTLGNESEPAKLSGVQQVRSRIRPGHVVGTDVVGEFLAIFPDDLLDLAVG